MDDYQAQRLAVQLKIVHQLLTIADERGLTHGEKHHFNEVARHMLRSIHTEMVGQNVFSYIHEVTPDEANDLPF